MGSGLSFTSLDSVIQMRLPWGCGGPARRAPRFARSKMYLWQVHENTLQEKGFNQMATVDVTSARRAGSFLLLSLLGCGASLDDLRSNEKEPIMTTRLSYETLVSDGVVCANGSLPSGEALVSSPITSTLIFGSEDAVLIDPPMTIAQTQGVADWLA